jgi:hypothetical protein
VIQAQPVTFGFLAEGEVSRVVAAAPNVSEQNLATPLEAFAATVGSEHLLTSRRGQDLMPGRHSIWPKSMRERRRAA